jgi:hypothetical protein
VGCGEGGRGGMQRCNNLDVAHACPVAKLRSGCLKAA